MKIMICLVPLAFKGRSGNPFFNTFGTLWAPEAHNLYVRERFFIDFGSLLGPSGHLKLIMWGIVPSRHAFVSMLGRFWDPPGSKKS